MIPITTLANPLPMANYSELNTNLGLLSAGVCIPFGPVTLSAAGSVVADLATITVPFARYLPVALTIEAKTAAGTLAAATVDVRTAAAGGGASVLSAPSALTGVTAVDKIINVTPVATDVRTASSLYLRQTVDSGNAGTIAGVLIVRPLP